MSWDFSSQIRKVLSNPQSQTHSKMLVKKNACGAKIYLWFKIRNQHNAHQFSIKVL